MRIHVTLGGAIALAAAICVLVSAPRPVQAGTDETQHTAAAVAAVDAHWSQAEIHGDVDFLNRMLAPDYRSVSADGKAITKSAIVEGARKNAASPERRQRIERYIQTHPIRTSVAMQGDTAVVTFSAPNSRVVLSSDVFTYAGGAWHAVYSQHTTAQ